MQILNCPGQTVVAGDVKGVDLFSEKIVAAGGKAIPLKVSAPFHCSLMKPAADKLALDLDALTINDPNLIVYSNVTAKPHKDASEVRENLKKQVCASVRWTDSMKNMIAEQNIDKTIEFGAGGVLSKLLKRIDKTPTRVEIAKPDDLEKL